MPEAKKAKGRAAAKEAAVKEVAKLKRESALPVFRCNERIIAAATELQASFQYDPGKEYTEDAFIVKMQKVSGDHFFTQVR